MRYIRDILVTLLVFGLPFSAAAQAGATWKSASAGGESAVDSAQEEEETEAVEEEPDSAAQPAGLAFELSGHFENRIFPSFVIGAATVKSDSDEPPAANLLGDRDGMIGVDITGVSPGDTLKVEISGEPYIKASTFEGSVPSGVDDGVWVSPALKYDFERLRQVTQDVPANVSAKVWVNGEALPEQTRVFKVHSVNEVMFGYQPSEEEAYDYSYLFASFVNENHPLVEELLKESLESGIVPSFDGYQSGDPDAVYAQAFAIWNALQKRGIRYSDITTTATESDQVYSQHVRFLEESVKNKQANCVDGSVLFASALRKIGLQPFLVLVPGHMFVGWQLDPQGETPVGLETTMLGLTDLAQVDSIKISETKKKKLKDFQSFDAFNAAVEAGTTALSENAQKFQDENEIQYQIIDLAAARKMGVTPISYR